ncbi:unnamed protein product [Arabidopsis thaliana]|uniref:Uncharacterized protein n=1 Tax=Arabidopsis thaliana TaxID=3702 RepID=Q9LTM9_ARATH|nr:unnamed protein product [Arabidopsis thaliana]
MLSRTAPCFNGDIRSHERVSLPFLDFIRFCKQHMSDKRNEAKPLSSINFWMNSAEARSSTHYDAVFMKVGCYSSWCQCESALSLSIMNYWWLVLLQVQII